MTEGNPGRTASPDPLARVVRRTQAVMLLERVTRCFWPLGSLLITLWSLLAFGLATRLGRTELMAVLAVTPVVALALLVRGMHRFRWPRRAEAVARVDATLPGRPLATLGDRQAIGRDDAGAAAVWAYHMELMRRLARAARVPHPDLRLASRDPWALRLAALVLLVAALVFARGDGIATLGPALAPKGGAAVAAGPSFDAWVRPPTYTGKPTLYLPEVPNDRPVEVPQGSEVTFRVYGAPTDFTLNQTVAKTAAALTDAADGIATATFPVAQSGSIALLQRDRPMGNWEFAMLPDQPPWVDLAEPVGRTVTGEMQISYTAEDDHGVTGGQAEITLDLPQVDRRFGLVPDPLPREPLRIDLPLPVSGTSTQVTEVLVEDVSKHPWVGMPVRITLRVRDAVGQEGVRANITAELPGRRFYDPTAAALIEQRRDLLWSPANLGRVTQVLRAVTYRPEGAFDSPRAYLMTRTAIRELAKSNADGSGAAVIPEVAEALWQAALLIEDGGLSDAAERLARAQERLKEALQGDATNEEIAELMEELRQATRDYMEQMAREAIERGEMQRAENDPGQQTITQDQLQQLMDRIQELSEQGRRAEAEQLLEQLRQLLENMEMRFSEGGQGQGQQGQGGQAMQDLADTLREQQDLADDSFQQLQRQFQQNRQGQPGQQGGGQPGQPGQQQPGQGGPGAEQPGPGELANRQEALRQLMEQLQGRLPGPGSESGEAARESLGEAERNMAEARDRLRDGDTAGALDEQSEVIDNLREGMRQMAEEMREAQQGQQQAGGEGMGEQDGRSDPLGRPLGPRGNVGTNESMVPDADSAARARALLDEIRRRAGEQARPRLELDYLRRLLERF